MPDLTAFASHSLELYCQTDATGFLRWANNRWTDLLGWDPSDLAEMPWVHFVHPVDVPQSLAVLRDIQETQTPKQFRIRMRRKDGATVWVEWAVHPTETGAWACVGRDVTAAVESARLSEHRLQQLEMAERISRTGHWRMDLVHDRLTWSDEVFRIHGFEPGAFVPDLRSAIEAYHPEDRPRVQAVLKDAIAHEEPFEFELRMLRPDGSVRLVQSMGRPEVDPHSGAVVALFGAFRDITEDDRSRRYDELEQFAYIASHDIKQPIRTVRALTSALMSTLPELDPGQRALRDAMTHSLDRMTVLLEDLRRYTAANQRPELEPVALDQVVSDAVTDLGDLIGQANGDIEIEALPVARGSAIRLRQVFQNLLTNAVRYRHPDRPLQVRIAARREDRHWVTVVSDNGIGFSDTDAQRIFEPFRRLDHSKEGTGIGLAIAQRIVTQCGGAIRAHGRPNQGATFEVLLPVAD